MPKASPYIGSLNAGEWSPKMEGRVDLAKHQSACAIMENFIPMVQGGATKRSGTRFVHEVKDSSKTVRLVNFEFSETQAYILEFGDLYMRVYMDGGIVTESSKTITGITQAITAVVTSAGHGFANGDEVYIDTVVGMTELNGKFFTVANQTPNTFELSGEDSTAYTAYASAGTAARVYELTLPYAHTELDGLQWVQSADVLYLAHKSHPPQKISRSGHTSWTVEEIAFNWPAFQAENSDDSVTVYASAVTGSITITASLSMFTADSVGSYFRIAEFMESKNQIWETSKSINKNRLRRNAGNVYESGSSGTTGNKAPVHLVGTESDGGVSWVYRHSGSGYAKITAYSSPTVVTADVIERFPDSVVGGPVTIAGITNATTAVVSGTFSLFREGDKVYISGVVGMPEVNDRYFFVGAVGVGTFELAGEDSTSYGTYASGGTAYKGAYMWSHGAWSITNGYPRTVTFYEDRLWWAGTSEDPQAMWASRTGDYENHRRKDDEADSSLLYTINADKVNTIRWLSSGDIMVAGTVGAEFTVSAMSSDEAITPGNIRVQQRTTRGGIAAQPIRVDNVILFIQRSGLRIREMIYDFSNDSYVAPDVTLLADHITATGMIGLAYQQEPNQIIWGWRGDGTLVGLTYERTEEVVGWHRHLIAGVDAEVVSCAVIPDDTADQPWLIVKRTIDSGTKQYVEYIERAFDDSDDQKNAFFVDSGLTYDGASTVTVSGLDHLEGETVSILIDGAAHPTRVVSSGAITLDTAGKVIQVGLGYTGTVQTMRIEAGAADGTAQGKTKRITGATIRFHRTGPRIRIGPTTSTMDEIPMRNTDDLMDAPIPLFTGDSGPHPWPGGYEKEGRITIQHDLPLPCTVLAIMPQLNTQDR